MSHWRRLKSYMDHHRRLEALVARFAAAISDLGATELDLLENALSARPIATDKLSLALARSAHGQNPPSVDLAGAGLPRLIPLDEGTAALKVAASGLSTAWIGSEVVALVDLAETLSVSDAVIDGWALGGHLIVLRSTPKVELVPLDQFVGGRPADGITHVVALFPNGEEAWAWLAAPNALLESERPIDCLHAGQASTVVRAAAGALDFA